MRSQRCLQSHPTLIALSDAVYRKRRSAKNESLRAAALTDGNFLGKIGMSDLCRLQNPIVEANFFYLAEVI